MHIEKSFPVIKVALPAALLVLALGSIAWGVFTEPPAVVTLDQVRVVDAASRRVPLGATSAQRFGGAAMTTTRDSSLPDFHWGVPEGWQELAGTDLRLANLRPAGHPDAECYLTVLPGSGGGLAGNVNRWRAQMGLEPADGAAIAALPTVTLRGEEASLVELEGTFTGMGGPGKEGWAFLGAIHSDGEFTVFVKMTGPRDVLAAEREGFFAFCESIHVDGPDGSHPSHGTVASEGEADPAAPSSGTPGPAEGPFAYVRPEGWSEAGPRTMRVVNLLAGESTQCYVTILHGEGGGLLPNANRWMREMGEEPLSEARIAELPTVSMLGKDCPLIELSGDFSGTGADPGSEMSLVGTMLIDPGGSVFVKMVGPSEEVAAARSGFVEFVQSLEAR